MPWLATDVVQARPMTRGKRAFQDRNFAVQLRHEESDATCIVVQALGVRKGGSPVIMDVVDYMAWLEEELKGNAGSIYAQQNGYAYMRSTTDSDDPSCHTHHSFVMRTAGTPIPLGSSIDHINWQKTDNRRVNLRVATQSEQQENRAERADKAPPVKELQDLGIQRLPRRIRWDVSEDKFVVDLPSGATLSGTKSVNVSLVNKLRDCVLKMVAHLEKEGAENDELGEQRMRLAEQYNDIVAAAHAAYPKYFSDGPYADIEGACGELEYCRRVLALLPAVSAGDVLHGALCLAKDIVSLPDIRAIAIVKGGKCLLFDAELEDLVRRLPEIDVNGGTPCVPITQPLLQLFPSAKAAARGAGKLPLKEVVWCHLLKRDLLDGHCVIPINNQQDDVRAANLRMLPGTGKEHKGPEGIQFVPQEADGAKAAGMRFLPRGVSLSFTSGRGRSPWLMYFRNRSTGKRTAFLCGPATFMATFRGKLLPAMRSADPDFEATNAAYQRLLGECENARKVLLNGIP